MVRIIGFKVEIVMGMSLVANSYSIDIIRNEMKGENKNGIDTSVYVPCVNTNSWYTNTKILP
jgi:hypothetical protein